MQDSVISCMAEDVSRGDSARDCRSPGRGRNPGRSGEPRAAAPSGMALRLRRNEFMNWKRRICRTVRRVLLPVLLALAVAAVSTGTMPDIMTAEATTVDALTEQKNATQSKLNAANSETSALESEEAAIEAEIEARNEQLVEILAAIQLLEEEIAELEVQIDEKQEEYDQAKADEEERYAAMKQRIKYMYEQGDATYVQVLLQATSFSDLINKVGYVNQLYEYDRNMLEEYQQVQEQVAQVQQELEERKSEEEEAKRGLEEEQAALEETVAALEEESEDISAQLEEAYAAAAELAQQLTEQTAALSEAVEAAAAAAAAAEAEAAAASSGTDDSSSSDSSSSSEDTTSSSSSTTTTSSTTLVANSNGVTGQDVVNYACQFVGNPYVYGGNSLTEGTDCSGFTSLVYAYFGYSIGRTDVLQRSAGIEVDSLENALPGDIICYAGHVALYCGNGTIVHASTAATGIKYSSATYRTYITIRRIIY